MQVEVRTTESPPSRGLGGSHIVDEPDQAHGEQAPAVTPQHEQVRRARVLHGVLAELLGLLELEAHDQEDEREDVADAQARPPYRAVVLVLRGRGDDVCWGGRGPALLDKGAGRQAGPHVRFWLDWELTGNKCAHHETPVDHRVREEDEPPVAGPGLQLAARLGAAHATGRVFTYINTIYLHGGSTTNFIMSRDAYLRCRCRPSYRR